MQKITPFELVIAQSLVRFPSGSVVTRHAATRDVFFGLMGRRRRRVAIAELEMRIAKVAPSADGLGDDDRVRAAGRAVCGAQWRAGLSLTNAVSLVVNCESQPEIDHYWEKLAADGGEQIQCGWLKDKFGMPWQTVPAKVWDWLTGGDPTRVQRVTAALWQMEKLDLAELERAAEKN